MAASIRLVLMAPILWVLVDFARYSNSRIYRSASDVRDHRGNHTHRLLAVVVRLVTAPKRTALVGFADYSITQKDGRKHPKHDEGYPNATNRTFVTLCGNFCVEQFVIRGDLAHLGFKSRDFIITVVALTFFKGLSGPGKSTIAPIGQFGDGNLNATHNAASPCSTLVENKSF